MVYTPACPASPGPRRLDVLVIDDHPSARRLLATALMALGHRTHLAASGDEGVRAARLRTFDFILLDLAMPGIDGLETARRIRAQAPACAATPIAAITASVRAGLAEAVSEAGMDAYLLKPIDVARLARTMALLTSAALVDAAERDQVHRQDDHQEPDNDAHRTHALPRA